MDLGGGDGGILLFLCGTWIEDAEGSRRAWEEEMVRTDAFEDEVGQGMLRDLVLDGWPVGMVPRDPSNLVE